MSNGVEVELIDVSKAYGRRQVIQNLSLTVGAGQCVGLVGPNGSGKTTLLRMLVGYFPPTSGVVRIGGVATDAESFTIRQWVGYVPEAVALYPEWTVHTFLRWCGRVRRVSRLAERLEGLRQSLDLGAVWRRPLGVLSKGYRQRVAIAQAMLHEPRLLVLDEPTNGVDPHHSLEIRRTLGRLRGRTTVMWSSHVLTELEDACDRVVALDRGRIVADEWLAGSGAPRWVLEVVGPRDLRELLRSFPAGELEWELSAADGDDTASTLSVRLGGGAGDPSELITWLVEHGVRVRRVERSNEKLEDRAAKWLKDS